MNADAFCKMRATMGQKGVWTDFLTDRNVSYLDGDLAYTYLSPYQISNNTLIICASHHFTDGHLTQTHARTHTEPQANLEFSLMTCMLTCWE